MRFKHWILILSELSDNTYIWYNCLGWWVSPDCHSTWYYHKSITFPPWYSNWSGITRHTHIWQRSGPSSTVHLKVRKWQSIFRGNLHLVLFWFIVYLACLTVLVQGYVYSAHFRLAHDLGLFKSDHPNPSELLCLLLQCWLWYWCNLRASEHGHHARLLNSYPAIRSVGQKNGEK